MRFMLATGAPGEVLRRYLATTLSGDRKNECAADMSSFSQIVRGGCYSKDWFTSNIPYWSRVLASEGLRNRAVRALEVGSWEGMSSRFILEFLPNAVLTCVDTWRGSDEHSSVTSINQVEERFDSNLETVRNRLTKYKGTSLEYFATCGPEKFDLIYIDGSHHCDDVIVDAVKGFELLAVGGVMIFDDYLWRFYPRPLDNPAAAINTFLRLKRGSYRLLEVYWQLVLVKVRENSLRARSPDG
jgi:predicted O-methyltransferase YrrM